MHIQIIETSLDFYKTLSDELEKSHLIIDPEEYTLFENPDHRYFAAYDADRLAGVSAMVRYVSGRDKETRVYHRLSWTHPDYRRQGIWTKIMHHKFLYCKQHAWCVNKTTHLSSCSVMDDRYYNLGWKYWRTGQQPIPNGSLRLRDWWYTNWQQIKTSFHIED